MEAITINIKNPALTDKVTWFLKHLEADGLEIVDKEDMQDLKALSATRDEASIPFSEYLADENQHLQKRDQKSRILFDVNEDTIEIGRILHRKDSYS